MAGLPDCKPRDLTSVLKVLPGKIDIKRHSPSILYFRACTFSRKL